MVREFCVWKLIIEEILLVEIRVREEVWHVEIDLRASSSSWK